MMWLSVKLHNITWARVLALFPNLKAKLMPNKLCLNIIFDITLYRSITMFCGTDNILQYIPSFRLNVKNILQRTVSPTITAIDLNNVGDFPVYF